MIRLPRPHVAALCAVVACALAAPPAFAAKHRAAAGPQAGTVLSAAHGTVRLVDRHHVVSDAHVRSTRGLKRGAVVAIRGGRAQLRGRARTISFYGRVVRHSARGAVLRLADGSTFKLATGRSGHGARAASTLTIDLQGLAPGQAVLITISSNGKGDVVLTIKLLSDATPIGDGHHGHGHHGHGRHDRGAPSPSTSGDEGDSSDDNGDEVDGNVTAIADDRSSITVDPGDGSDLATIPVSDPSVLDGVSVGDDVAVIVDADGTAIEVDVLGGDGEDPSGQQGDGGDAGDAGGNNGGDA